MSANAKLNVSLTNSYRLSSDNERNFTIEQLVTVDPTKAPGYKPPTDGSTPPVRQEWRDTGRYFAMNGRGLTAALEFVIMRQSAEDGTAAGTLELREFAQIIGGHSERLSDAVNYVVTTGGGG